MEITEPIIIKTELIHTVSAKRKAGKNPKMNAKEMSKRLKLEGLAYRSVKTGKIVPAKSNLEQACNCSMKCTDSFTAEEKVRCLRFLLDGRTKNEQDTFLMGLIIRKEPKRRRSRSVDPKRRDHVFEFYVLRGNQRIKVCRLAFNILYAIGNRAVYRLCTLVAEGRPPSDMRGKHQQRGNAIPPEVCLAIDEHIREFPLIEYHFPNNKVVHYMSEDLDIKTLHRRFCETNPELADRVKYSFYLKYYKENYGYKFGRPMTTIVKRARPTTEKTMSRIKEEPVTIVEVVPPAQAYVEQVTLMTW